MLVYADEIYNYCDLASKGGDDSFYGYIMKWYDELKTEKQKPVSERDESLISSLESNLNALIQYTSNDLDDLITSAETAKAGLETFYTQTIDDKTNLEFVNVSISDTLTGANENLIAAQEKLEELYADLADARKSYNEGMTR